MAGAAWTKDDEAKLQQLWPAESWAMLLEVFSGRTRVGLERKAQALGLKKSHKAVREALASRPQSQRRLAWESIPELTSFERLAGDWVVSGDWHCPFVDPEMMELHHKVGKKLGIKQAVILGDYLDEQEHSHWTAIGASPNDVRFGDELVFAARALEGLVSNFEKVAFMAGNHDQRLLRLLKWSLSLSDVFALVGKRMADGLRQHMEKKVTVSEYPYATINNRYFVAHASTYSKIPGAVARDVAEIRGMSTILGNGHLLAMTKDRSGRHWAIDVGCLVQPDKVWYRSMRVTRHPNWTQGFVTIKNNLPALWDKEMARG